ncbi:MAG: hypothetical protein JNJ86_00475 [Chitinophagaceae bacterium]|jgi:hypothetical protein|nr:hypothetical protein [Chitinophagaceae bacterium]
MKHRNLRRTGSYSFFILSLLSFFFLSCEYHNFSTPQPADKESLYEFPRELRGSWVVINDTIEETISLSDSRKMLPGDLFSGIEAGPSPDPGNYISRVSKPQTEDSQYYFVEKEHAYLITTSEEKVLMGDWPRLSQNGGMLNPPIFYGSVRSIRYDSLQKRTDTVYNYMLHDNFIYEVGDKGLLEKGYPYLTAGDTILFTKRDTLCIDMGQNAFLRKLNKQFYVLNIRSRILGEEISSFNNWWRIFVLEKREDGSIQLWIPASKAAKLPCMFYSVDAESYYFDCSWTTDEMVRLLNEGYFVVTDKLSKVN